MKEDVYQTIRERILYLEYKPGQILNEKILAEEFKVSRSPIKDVLNRLVWDTFIRIIPRTGSMVTEIEFSRILHVYQVRFEMEAFEARLAVNQFSSAHHRQFEKMVNQCNTLLSHKDPKKLSHIDISLRNIIHKAAGNPVLADLSDRLYFQTFRLWYSVLEQGGWKEEVLAVKTEVEKTRDCIISDRPETLVDVRHKLLMAHFERLRNKFLGA